MSIDLIDDKEIPLDLASALGAIPDDISPPTLVTPPFAAPAKTFSVPLASPLSNLVISDEDAANVVAANAAGTFRGFRRNEPWSDPAGMAKLAKSIRDAEKAATLRRRKAMRSGR